MRNHSIIAPTFWTGVTGKVLRGDPELQVVAMYLITSPHATMIGVFTCPVLYIAHETGLPHESVERALARLEALKFCLVDRDRDLIWVREMARFQVGEALSPGDKRVKNVGSLFAKIALGAIREGFFERYSTDFHLLSQGPPKGHPTKREAPSKGHPESEKPLRSQEQDQEQEQVPSDLTVGDGNSGSRSSSAALRTVFDPPPLRLVRSDPPAEPEPPDPADPSVAERELFARAKAVAGPNFGGQVSKLIKAKGGNVALARAALETASTKHNPREYLARIIRGDDTGLPAGQLYDRSI